MIRSNVYEAAFAAYLRGRAVGVLPVVEAGRALLDTADVKSPDFLVVGMADARLVVDVKGRKFPGGPADKPRKVWENWSTSADVDGLNRWAGRFGPTFRGVLAFVYRIMPVVELLPHTPDLFPYQGNLYLMRGVGVVEYAAEMRARSKSWGTVALPTAAFRRLVKPFSMFLDGTAVGRPLAVEVGADGVPF